MREYELEILEQYDIKINGTRKVRGAFFCDTNEGTMLLKETKMSDRRAPFFYKMLLALIEIGEFQVELPIKNKEDNFISTSKDGSRYMLKKWFVGRECDVHKEKEIICASKKLASLHKMMQWKDENEECVISAGRHLKEEILCHNREMKKVRSYIRSKATKGKFEYLYLQSFDQMFRQAQQTLDKLEESGYERLYKESIEQKKIVHGDYNYHNILVLPDQNFGNARTVDNEQQMAITGFEHFCFDVQVQDLYYYLRKVLEKYHWDVRVGDALLKAYDSIRPLRNEEIEFLAIRLSYPEKFWKTASGYYRSNKAWTSEKNVEKLAKTIAETEEKKKLLRNLFMFEL